jgi:putative DNA primase/helicase
MKYNTNENQEMLDLLQEVGGYIVSGANPGWLQKFFILFGDGENGKTSFAYAIQACIGKENNGAASPKDLSSKEGRASLVGKLFNYFDELPKNLLQSDTLKYLATGAPIEYRNLYSSSVVATFPAKLMFSANTMPKNNDATHGMIRKIVILPFFRKIPKKMQIPIPELKDMFTKEAAGIFNHFYEGYQRLKKINSFTQCAVVDDMVEEFRISSDSVLEWSQNNLVKEDDKFVGSTLAYDTYKGWCINNGKQHKSTTNFGITMSKLYGKSVIKRCSITKKQLRGYNNLKIVDDFTGEEIGTDLTVSKF